MNAGVVSNPIILKWGSRTGHPSTLHRPEYPHISPPFLSCPSAASGAAKKHIRQEDIYITQHTPSSRMIKMLPGVNVVIAAYRHGCNERNCAYSNNNRHHNSTPKRTPVTNTYIKTYEHVMLLDVASSLSRRPSRNTTKSPRSLE